MRRSAVTASFVCLLAAACGKGTTSDGTACTHDFDCKAGEGCVDGTCEALPCGGCQADQACSTGGTCITAQGAACDSVVACPAGFPCNSGGTCAKPCTINNDCETGFVCNSGLKSCTQCAFNGDCKSAKGMPVCDTDPTAGASASSGQGLCVECNVGLDCTKALGSGHYCDDHVCKPGCAGDNDCSANAGETCDTSTTPGKCIQCHTNTDCLNTFGSSLGVCDDTNHCVQCWASDQGTASSQCTPDECNLTTKTCVQCLLANNAGGKDCGYGPPGSRDAHDESTCNPSSSQCVPGCATDAQCGCPNNGPGNTESLCGRYAVQEHCDPARTASVDQPGTATLGACVECRPGHSEDCSYTVVGNHQYTSGPSSSNPYAVNNGAYCVNDSCKAGCGADADCWPDHATSNGKICHLGPAGDPNNNKCVTCACDSPGTEDTWCSSAKCTGTKVCDTATLTCRQKQQGETCLHDTECGSSAASLGSTCNSIGGAGHGFCMQHATPNLGDDLYCFAGGNLGRCADFCDDICACASGSSCFQATSTDGVGTTACKPTSCDCSVSSCSG
ncbi:MAG TPA: hypothetical protein VLW85_04745 [Myxococcales bacterium]|nr:hypothetical protein [Myxococcales bacterium]